MSEGRFRPHKHDMCRTPTWRSWNSMIQRCTNQKATAYEQYGGRGITICPQWFEFSAFLESMGERPSGTTLDRINPDGNYELCNCRWASKREQQRNRRDCVRYTLNGESLTLQEWAERTGIPYETIRGRHRLGWLAEYALSIPSSKANSVNRKNRTYQRNEFGRFQ